VKPTERDLATAHLVDDALEVIAGRGAPIESPQP
jgi:hypothetical protein